MTSPRTSYEVAAPTTGTYDVPRSGRSQPRSLRGMTDPTPYLLLPGTAGDALRFYGDVFGCSVQLHTFAEFGRTDGPADAVAHGYLTDGPVALFAADVSGDESPLHTEGLMLSLLGTADAPTLRTWFARLAEGGRVVDDLQTRPWGASDGQVIDRHGLRWLIGFEVDESD
jgi:PhnB protein